MTRISIRSADLNTDALAITDGARDFAERSVVKPILGDDFVSIVSKIITLLDTEILLAEHDGRVVGGIAVFYIPYLWNPGVLTAEELFWWTMPGAPFGTGRDLFNDMMLAIDGKVAIPMFRALTSGRKGFDRTYRRSGMEPVETLYMRTLKCR